MAAWIIPALKAVLPHVGTIISATAPAFTKKPAQGGADQTPLVQEQIAELQTAVSQNAVHIKELAAQLQSTVAALEQAAALAEARLRRAYLAAILALVLSIAAVALVLILAR
ncbi:MAG: hypothetical protein WCZ87_11530 [Thiohalobacteraceae bacterium]